MRQKSILKQKKKQKQKTRASERVAVHALQKQMQVLRLKEYLFIVAFIVGGALLRVPMQAVPSAEPISFFALLAGWLFGKKKGFLVGASSLYISNFFVFGGHGIWTVFQALGFGIVGFLGGFLRKKSSLFEVVLLTIIATIIYETIVNIGSVLMFPGFNIFILFLTALPFMLIHLVSSSLFALFLPKVRKMIYERGGFHEKELCAKLLNSIRGNRDSNWLLHAGKEARG
jgi:energy-coupling factor transport system substrate-specific component